MTLAKKKAQKPVAIGKNNKSKIPLNPNSKTSKKLSGMTEENISPKIRQTADLFINEYLKDRNATQAFIRSRKLANPFQEITTEYANQQGYIMTRWPYVACKIQEAMEIAEEENIVTRKEVLFGLKREALREGLGAQHGARVGAWGKLANILGMETQKIEQTLAMKGGVMIVPATETLADWEKRSSAAQEALKKEVRK